LDISGASLVVFPSLSFISTYPHSLLQILSNDSIISLGRNKFSLALTFS
jgi:hypothetical protein